MRYLLHTALFTLAYGTLCAVPADEINTLYCDIGKELITIRKENPNLQSTVYSLLDQVGKLYRSASTVLQEKERAIQVAQEDREATVLLRSENDKLKGEVTKLKGDLDAKNLEVVQAKQQVHVLGREQQDLLRRASEGETARKEFEQRVEELKSLKPQTQGESEPDRASLEGDRARAAMQEFASEVQSPEST